MPGSIVHPCASGTCEARCCCSTSGRSNAGYCYRSFPWSRQREARFQAEGLQVIGIHTPEFEFERERERDPAAVRAKVSKFALEHPVMIDNDSAYWNALGNHAWPTFYLIDKQGRIRDRFLGETYAGEPQARRTASPERLERNVTG